MSTSSFPQRSKILRKASIFWVDDEIDSFETDINRLGEKEVTVTGISNLEKAINLLQMREINPDIVICDFLFEEHDQKNLLPFLRLLSDLEHNIPILIFSGEWEQLSIAIPSIQDACQINTCHFLEKSAYPVLEDKLIDMLYQIRKRKIREDKIGRIFWNSKEKGKLLTENHKSLLSEKQLREEILQETALGKQLMASLEEALKEIHEFDSFLDSSQLNVIGPEKIAYLTQFSKV